MCSLIVQNRMPNLLSFACSIKRIESQSLEAKERKGKKKVKKEWKMRKNLSDAFPGSNSTEIVTIKLF